MSVIQEYGKDNSNFDFPIQLGSVQEPYGFDGILGIDFMMSAKCKADFETMQIDFSV